MTEFLIHNWGSLTSLAGLVVSVVGLAWAIRVARQARTAARAAQAASIETRAVLGRTLSLVDIQRAISLIRSIQEALRRQQHPTAVALCPSLSAMLHDINVSITMGHERDFPVIHGAVAQISAIELLISLHSDNGPDSRSVSECQSQLISIRNALEKLASSIMFSTGPEGE